MITASGLEALLADSGLSDRSVRSVDIPDCPEPALLFDALAHERREVWSTVRELLPRTGRWPVFIAGELDWQLNHPLEEDGTTRLDLVARSQTITAEAAVRGLELDTTNVWEFHAQNQLAAAVQRFGDAPTLESARQELGPGATEVEFERWLFDWEEAKFPGVEHGLAGGEYSSFDPRDPASGIVLLPTPHSWESLAYLSFWGAFEPGRPERAVALLRSWHERFGAELWAFYGTMLEFVVRRPPSTVEEAWPLAVEHHCLAPSTNYLPGVALRANARWLVGRKHWHLHEKP